MIRESFPKMLPQPKEKKNQGNHWIYYHGEYRVFFANLKSFKEDKYSLRAGWCC